MTPAETQTHGVLKSLASYIERAHFVIPVPLYGLAHTHAETHRTGLQKNRRQHAISSPSACLNAAGSD